MTINSISFIYFILPLFVLYYAVKKCMWQNIILTIGSVILLLFSDLKMSWCVLTMTLFAYLLGIGIDNEKTIYRKRLLLIPGIIIAIGALVYFKYLDFFTDSFANILKPLGINTETLHIIAPLGVSFYVFRIVSYLMDIYRKEMSACKNPCDVFLYTCFFPTFLSGPIDRGIDFFPQLRCTREFNYAFTIIGCRQILWGMFKKMVIADNIATQVNTVWNELTIQSSWNLILVAILYFFQLYMDFSGYSDMAIGVGKILGIDITKNFHYPFFSRNISEFWRRWHMSLNNWFVHYLYIPLGGSRNGKTRTIINTLTVFTFCGFWHGSTLNFAIWGFFNGVLFIPIIITGNSHKYKNSVAGEFSWLPSPKEVGNILLTFVLGAIGFIIFRAPDLTSIWDYFSSLTENWSVPTVRIWDNYANICLLTIGIEWFMRRKEFPLSDMKYKFSKFINPIIYIILVELILHYGALISSSFIYAKF